MVSIGDMIDSFIDEKDDELANQEMELVIDVFRNDFDKMTKLVKIFKKNKGKKGYEKGAYKTIAEMLFQKRVCKQDGSELSVSQVSRYMGIVRAERVGTKSKSKAVETQAVSVARPGAVPGANKTAPAGRVAVDDSDAIPEKITGYDALKKLQEWEKVKAIMSDDSYQWDDADETLYGQLRRYVFRFGEPVAGQGIIDVCRKKFPNQTGFPNSLAQSVEKLFNKREQHKGLAHWTM